MEHNSTGSRTRKAYSPVEKLKILLKGKNEISQERLDELFDSLRDNPKILWYPSAGNDYRDILELSEVEIDEENITGGINIVTDYGIPAPNLFIHTDYSKTSVTLEIGELFNDGQTSVIAKEIYPLSIDPSVRYEINANFVDFPEHAPHKPEIYLLDLEISSNKLGKIEKPVIYFLFENINFFREVLLEHRINLAYMVKVREGCGFGGNKKSVSNIYPYFSFLKTEYLILDDEIHFDRRLLNMALKKEELRNFELIELQPQRQIWWSGFQVHVYKVEAREGLLTRERIREIFRPMQRRWHRA